MAEGEEMEYAAQGRSLERQLNFVFRGRGWGWVGVGWGGGPEFRRNFANAEEAAFGRNFEVNIATPAREADSETDFG